MTRERILARCGKKMPRMQSLWRVCWQSDDLVPDTRRNRHTRDRSAGTRNTTLTEGLMRSVPSMAENGRMPKSG